MTWRQKLVKFLPPQGDKSLIVWAPPLRQCNYCQVCSECTVLLCTNSHRPLHYISKHRPMLGVFHSQIQLLGWLTARSLWSDNTSEWNGRPLQNLQKPGHPLTRHSHLALLILSIPLHDSGDPAHITRLSSDHSPSRTSTTYNIITVISVTSSSAGREGIQLDVKWERSRGWSQSNTFGFAISFFLFYFL